MIPTCATVAYLYHHAPRELLRLPYPAAHKRGRGPFYVIGPAKRKINMPIEHNKLVRDRIPEIIRRDGRERKNLKTPEILVK